MRLSIASSTHKKIKEESGGNIYEESRRQGERNMEGNHKRGKYQAG